MPLKKVLIYSVLFIYITISLVHYHLGSEYRTGIGYFDTGLTLFFVPGNFISLLFGLFDDTIGEFIGYIFTLVIVVALIERKWIK